MPNNPRNEEAGSRKVPFTRELYIEKSDFAEVPPPKFQRLKPDGEVRLMGAYIVKCNEIVKDDNGEIVEIRCTADLESPQRHAGGRPQGQGHHSLGICRARHRRGPVSVR